ncbi:MAG: endonuclease/exonuclease/phosphatase family protein [Clostridium sp.]|nr:endonuclease/exonuclease/phosphatase family protein [Bacteroides sp.]MCM1197428.1 endonuclease/exonuclease/phosphatase family protein [Clostridium sp.]
MKIRLFAVMLHLVALLTAMPLNAEQESGPEIGTQGNISWLSAYVTGRNAKPQRNHGNAHGLPGDSTATDNVSVMFWNLENFFDYFDGGTSDSDKEFSSMGNRHWTKSRFHTKCNAVAKTIFWVQEYSGRLPDVIGLAEVENRFALNSLLNNTLLRKTDYEAIHFDSPDRRGIDVAMIYRSDIFRKISAKPCRIYDDAGNIIPTRDILCVELCRIADESTMYFLVNHHPSKFGGASASQSGRRLAMDHLKGICDSLSTAGMPERAGLSDGVPSNVAIIAMGDFNDTPDNGLFNVFDGCMENLAERLFRKGEGTIRYAGKWDLIDMFLVSSGLAGDYVQEILYPPFLMEPDRTHGGRKPLRTYIGPRYNGGVSDHCPILLRPRIPKK